MLAGRRSLTAFAAVGSYPATVGSLVARMSGGRHLTHVQHEMKICINRVSAVQGRLASFAGLVCRIAAGTSICDVFPL